MSKQRPPKEQLRHFDEESGEWYYSCGCANCNHEMLWPRSMFSAWTNSRWNVATLTYVCKCWEEFKLMNKHFRYSVYRMQYRQMLRRDGLPRVKKLSSRIKYNKKQAEYLEFAKLFEKLDRDENGYYLCPVYNIPMHYTWQESEGHTKRSGNAPSVDRIDNDKPHTLDNIQIISWAANNHKGNGTLEEMVLQGEHAKRLLEKQGKL